MGLAPSSPSWGVTRKFSTAHGLRVGRGVKHRLQSRFDAAIGVELTGWIGAAMAGAGHGP
jgi:hypothetical protein